MNAVTHHSNMAPIRKIKRSHTLTGGEQIGSPFARLSTSLTEMAKILFLLAVLVLGTPATATEYKLCASAENEIFCKWIEASRSEVTCVRVSDSVDCLLKMQKKQADFGTFSAEEAFLANRFLGDAAVVLAEIRHPDRADRNFSFETVAVVKSNFFGGLSALKGLSYCHPGFSKAQYWSDRVLKDFEKKVLEHFKDDIKCNSAMRSAYEDDLYRLSMVFGKACRPGTWAVSDWWDKKLKRDYKMLCDQCDHANTCSYGAHNKGKHSDALRCLTLRGGNVTYTALEYVQEYFGLNMEEEFFTPEHQNPARYDFLCEDGSTRPLTSANPCSWVKQPWPSVIALKSVGSEMSKNLKWWLEENEGQEKASVWSERLKSILGKGSGVLKFRDEPMAVSDYLKEGRTIPDASVETCRGAVRWCTACKVENKKCEYLSAAALIHGLPTQVRCVEGTSKKDCLKKIRKDEADVVYIDSDMGYVARKVFNLTTAAYVETQRTGNYYGVVVVKGESIKQFKSLRGKKACFPMYNGLGWMTFVKALKDQRVIPERSCSGARKAREYFSKACAPGVRDPNINLHWTKDYERLTKGCYNDTSESSVEPTLSNPYYGEKGALRCLNNGDGDVAFLDFFAAKRFLESNRQNSDANMQAEDFRILCRDGSIENFNLTNPDKCSFTQINGGEVVTRKDLDQIVRNDIYLTLMELDDLFGTTSRNYNPVLKMFEPFDGEPNALFKESSVSLAGVYQTQNTFVNNYVKLLQSFENCMGENSSSALLPSALVLCFSLLLLLRFQL